MAPQKEEEASIAAPDGEVWRRSVRVLRAAQLDHQTRATQLNVWLMGNRLSAGLLFLPSGRRRLRRSGEKRATTKRSSFAASGKREKVSSEFVEKRSVATVRRDRKQQVDSVAAAFDCNERRRTNSARRSQRNDRSIFPRSARRASLASATIAN